MKSLITVANAKIDLIGEKKAIIDHEQNMVSRKIKETIQSINYRNHINSISYSLPDIWIPALTKCKSRNTNNCL